MTTDDQRPRPWYQADGSHEAATAPIEVGERTHRQPVSVCPDTRPISLAEVQAAKTAWRGSNAPSVIDLRDSADPSASGAHRRPRSTWAPTWSPRALTAVAGLALCVGTVTAVALSGADSGLVSVTQADPTPTRSSIAPSVTPTTTATPTASGPAGAIGAGTDGAPDGQRRTDRDGAAAPAAARPASPVASSRPTPTASTPARSASPRPSATPSVAASPTPTRTPTPTPTARPVVTVDAGRISLRSQRRSVRVSWSGASVSGGSAGSLTCQVNVSRDGQSVHSATVGERQGQVTLEAVSGTYQASKTCTAGSASDRSTSRALTID